MCLEDHINLTVHLEWCKTFDNRHYPSQNMVCRMVWSYFNPVQSTCMCAFRRTTKGSQPAHLYLVVMLAQSKDLVTSAVMWKEICAEKNCWSWWTDAMMAFPLTGLAWSKAQLIYSNELCSIFTHLFLFFAAFWFKFLFYFLCTLCIQQRCVIPAWLKIFHLIGFSTLMMILLCFGVISITIHILICIILWGCSMFCVFFSAFLPNLSTRVRNISKISMNPAKEKPVSLILWMSLLYFCYCIYCFSWT